MVEKMDVEDGDAKHRIETDVKSEKSSGHGTCVKAIVIVLFLAMLACIIGLAVALAQKDTEDGGEQEAMTTPRITDDADEDPKSKSGKYRFGAVAADNVICSEIGTDILAGQKGSTIDAVIATLLCLGVVNSHSMGIGGGFLLTMYDSKQNKVLALNSREVAPLAATEDMYVNKSGASVLGGLAIAVPSEIAGYAELHMRYGTLQWADLFQPAIKLCEEGIPLPRALSRALQSKKTDVENQPGLREIFLNSNGGLLVEGDLFKRPKLAVTLRSIADDGAVKFYNGTLADDIVADIQDHGGIITNQDLSSYKPVWKDPIATTLNNGEYTLYGPPPPSSAVVLYYILNIMDGFNLTKSARETLDDNILLSHRLVEAMKFGYGKRSYLGDEDFVNVTMWEDLLQSDSYAEETRVKINDAKVLPFDDYDSAFEILNDGGTSHLSLDGPDGFAVSVTSTINTYLGSKMVGNRTGIIFNNEMDDFSTPGTVNNYGVSASPTNFIVPGKRPMSSMSPTIIMNKDGSLAGIIGASGGTRIITGTLETIMNNLWLGYNVPEALDQPRYHHQLLPDEILHEPIWPEDIRAGLAKKGHKFKVRIPEFCVVQFIRNYCHNKPSERYCIHAASDNRRGGAPDGY